MMRAGFWREALDAERLWQIGKIVLPNPKMPKSLKMQINAANKRLKQEK